MSIRSGDIRDQIWSGIKLTEIMRLFAPAPIFSGGNPRNFWTCIIKRTQFPIIVAKFHKGPRPIGDLR